MPMDGLLLEIIGKASLLVAVLILSYHSPPFASLLWQTIPISQHLLSKINLTI
jgi:hypothetical protein